MIVMMMAKTPVAESFEPPFIHRGGFGSTWGP